MQNMEEIEDDKRKIWWVKGSTGVNSVGGDSNETCLHDENIAKKKF